MQTPIEVIASYGASTESYIQAIHHFRRKLDPMTRDQHEHGIANIMGVEVTQFPTDINDKEIELIFLYTVQETIKEFTTGNVPDMDKLWERIIFCKDEFIKTSPWAIVDYSETVDLDGTTSKKVDKKQQSLELFMRMSADGTSPRIDIIDAMVDDIGLSKAGATTYFHNLKKQHGFKGPIKTKKPTGPNIPVATKSKNKKGPTKTEIAVAVYNEMRGSPKKEIIQRIVQSANTTPAGANTYLCAAKKIVGA